jgi:hypothetical protein
VDEPEREGDDPARVLVRFHDVLERHVEDRHRDPSSRSAAGTRARLRGEPC